MCLPTSRSATISLVYLFATLIPDDNSATPSPPADGTPADFGGTRVATGTVAHTFRIFNTGGNPLTVSNIEIAGDAAGDFTLTPLAFPVEVNNNTVNPPSTTFQITFDPSVEGDRNALVKVTSDDPDAEGTYTFAIKGVGGFPDIKVFVGAG